MQVHLKPTFSSKHEAQNIQYLRLTRLSKARSGEGLITRRPALIHAAKKLAGWEEGEGRTEDGEGAMAKGEKVSYFRQLE